VLGFARQFAHGACDDLIITTGEGPWRLLACIDNHDPALKCRFLDALAQVRKITRGPKPARALRELGLQPDLAAEVPTTEGIIASLGREDLRGRRIGVQLYGSDPNRPLIDFLERAGASVLTVAPYVYADAADDAAVQELLARLTAGEVDAIAFTSTQQVERMFAAATGSAVGAALARTLVAAVGPIVAEALARHGIRAQVMPQEAFFMKPLTTALEEQLGRGPR
jgi:uroporphyrinogen-III synthase